MSRNGGSMSGANNTPLGSRAGGPPMPPLGVPSSASLLNPSYLCSSSSEMESLPLDQPPPPPPPPSEEWGASNERKRLAAEAVEAARAASAALAAKVERKRKRKSRWAGETSEKTFIPGMPTMIPNGLSKDQEEGYLLQLKIEDTSRRLRSGDLGIPPNPEDRSPSPEPIYSSDGKRLNTREYRKRRELENTRHEAITRMLEINLEYKPPPDYKPPQVKVNDKVMIPQEEHPDINFVGLLIGPRGNTLKSMEKETGAKIIIRGKGSVKEGKIGRKNGQPLPGEDEPLHAYVTATDPDAVKRAVLKIKEIIRQGVDVPEGQNDLRKNQLRELALLNGTLREGDGLRCSNCGAGDHKSWQCQDKLNVTNNVVCTSCGGVGHISKDCTAKRPGQGAFEGNAANQNKMDDEYMSLMAELGEAPPPGIAEKTYTEGRITWGPAKNYQASRPPPPNRPPLGRTDQGEYGGNSSNYGYGGSGQEHWNNGNSNSSNSGSSNSSKPPSLMNQSVPPPWTQQQQGGSGSGPRWMPPNGGGSSGNWGSSGYEASSRPNFLAAPPPPPPSSDNRSSGSSGNWSMPPWGGAGGPVPPPPGTSSGPRPSGNAASSSAPPPPPPPSSSSSSSSYWPGSWSGGVPPPPGQNASAAAAANIMSNLMSAPPPPPPPS